VLMRSASTALNCVVGWPGPTKTRRPPSVPVVDVARRSPTAAAREVRLLRRHNNMSCRIDLSVLGGRGNVELETRLSRAHTLRGTSSVVAATGEGVREVGENAPLVLREGDVVLWRWVVGVTTFGIVRGVW